MPVSRLAAPALLVVAVAFGTYLRLWPSLPSGRTEFLSDGATIARLALEGAPTGRLPAIDSLAEAPTGRALGPVLAPGLIVGAGVFHRWMASLGSRDAAMDLTLFGALAGGLIAVPIYLWARVQWGSGWTPAVAALFVAFLPAHLHRTFGYFMRYEALGSLLVASHLACLAAALAAAGTRRRLAFAAAAAFFLAASLWSWRVPLIVPLIEAGLFAVLLVARGAERPARDGFAIQMAGGTIAAFALEYLRTQRMAGSGSWLAALALGGLAFVPRLAPGRGRAAERVVWVAGAVALGLLLGRFTGGAESYGSTVSFLATKMRLGLGLAVAPDPMTNLMLIIEELGSMSFGSLFWGPIGFSALGPWLLATPLLLWWAHGRPSRAALTSLPLHALFLAGTAITLLVLTMFVHRAKVLAAIPCVVALAGLVPVLLPAPSGRVTAKPAAPAAPAVPRPKSRSPKRGARSAGPSTPILRPLLALGFVVSAGVTLWYAYAISATRDARLVDGERAALEFVAARTPVSAVIAAPWGLGFEIQSYAHRRTLMDGFLESEVGRERMVAFARLGFEPSPEPLAGWCRSLGADYLLLPPSSQLLGLAVMAAPDLVAPLEAGARITPEQANRTIVRMMVLGGDQPPFRQVFEHERWRVYALAGPASGSAAEPATSPHP